MTTTLAYSVATAVSASGLSKSHLERAIRLGHLRARKSSVDEETGEPVGKYVILHADLMAYLENLPEA